MEFYIRMYETRTPIWSIVMSAMLPHCLVTSVVSNSLPPHVLQPARLLCPWDFLGKNTTVGCHALLQGIFLTQGSNPGLLHCRQILYHWATRETPWWALWSESESHLVVSDSLRPHGLQPTRLLCPWDFPGKSTGVGCHCLLWVPCIEKCKRKNLLNLFPCGAYSVFWHHNFIYTIK